MTAKALRPVLWMSDVYGPGHVYAPRAHDAACDWLPRGSFELDALTGGQLAIAGDTPVVCSAGFAAPPARDLFALAGLEFPANCFVFRAGEAREATARAAAGAAARLVLQHAYPTDSWESERCWIDPLLLRYLNRKDQLAALAPAEHVPERKVIDRAEFIAAEPPPLPVVLKAATDQSSGGGCGVLICRTRADLRGARTKFASCDQIVIEEMLDIVRNPCLTFAVMADGEARYLGFADQDLTSAGRHLGNWLDTESTLPPDVIGPAMDAVRRAAALGYRGFAGVDVASTSEERAYVLDLNFRLNASTAAVLLAPTLQERLGEVAIHSCRLHGSGSAEELAQAVRPFVASGKLLPLSLFDPAAAGYPGKAAMIQALVVGASRREVLGTEKELAAAGVA